MEIVAAKVIKKFKEHLLFSVGTSGDIDLSHLANKGVFQAWMKTPFFEQMTVALSGALAWPNHIDLCPNSLYLLLTKKQPEEIFPLLHQAYA